MKVRAVSEASRLPSLERLLEIDAEEMRRLRESRSAPEQKKPQTGVEYREEVMRRVTRKDSLSTGKREDR